MNCNKCSEGQGAGSAADFTKGEDKKRGAKKGTWGRGQIPVPVDENGGRDARDKIENNCRKKS